jgi:hypothetical protein
MPASGRVVYADRTDTPPSLRARRLKIHEPCSRGVGMLLPQLLQEYLCRRPISFRGIAGLTAGDHIALDAPPATSERDHMIHGQCVGGKGALAVCTDAFGNTMTPPLRRA